MAAGVDTAGRVLSVNLGAPRPIAAKSGLTGIDKSPVNGPVAVFAPGPKGSGGSGLEGDAICDRENHGGDGQAVYVYAHEDYEVWRRRLASQLRAGTFGENLTTERIDVNAALIGEHWQIGDRVVLAVTAPRVPCRTFAVWLNRRAWIKEFTHQARPGPYLRVIEPGLVSAGDSIRVVHRPSHAITVQLMFRALTLEPGLLPRVLEASDDLTAEDRDVVDARLTRLRSTDSTP